MLQQYTDMSHYARSFGYQSARPVLVQDGRVISHQNMDWFAFCHQLQKQHSNVEMLNLEKYAVSDHTGAYVFYTNDYHEAKTIRKELDESLAEEGIEGWGAIMRRVKGTGGYELYY